MAESEDTKNENKPKKEEYSSKVDFFSPDFDPLEALTSPGVSAPIPNAKRYDNLDAYNVAIEKEKYPEKFGKKKEPVKKPEVPFERKWLPHQMPIPSTKKQKSLRNVFTNMEKVQGPLALLKKCVHERLKIKLLIRNGENIRGYCLAYVVAFDKHFNMALEDVTEVWTRKKKKKIPALDTAESVRKSKFQRQFKLPEIKVTPHPTETKLENCTRHVAQILIRGEHVVLVSVVNQ